MTEKLKRYSMFMEQKHNSVTKSVLHMLVYRANATTKTIPAVCFINNRHSQGHSKAYMGMQGI